MWLRNGGLLAAVLAVLAIGLVGFAAWFTLIHGSTCELFFDACTRTGVGVFTLAIVLIAGSLMAYAFGCAEKAVALYARRSSEKNAEEQDRG